MNNKLYLFLLLLSFSVIGMNAPKLSRKETFDDLRRIRLEHSERKRSCTQREGLFSNEVLQHMIIVARHDLWRTQHEVLILHEELRDIKEQLHELKKEKSENV